MKSHGLLRCPHNEIASSIIGEFNKIGYFCLVGLLMHYTRRYGAVVVSALPGHILSGAFMEKKTFCEQGNEL